MSFFNKWTKRESTGETRFPGPSLVGACCKWDGTCEDLSEEECIDDSEYNVYRGNGLLCDDADIVCLPAGACCICVNESCACVMKTHEACVGSCPACNWVSADSCDHPTCDNSTICESLGSCCSYANGVASCVECVSKISCDNTQDAVWTEWTEDGVCNDSPFSCQPGRCCYADPTDNGSDLCEINNEPDCGELGGIWSSGGDCWLLPPCPTPTGSCCVLDSSGSQYYCDVGITKAECVSNTCIGCIISWIRDNTDYDCDDCGDDVGDEACCCLTGCTEPSGTLCEYPCYSVANCSDCDFDDGQE